LSKITTVPETTYDNVLPQTKLIHHHRQSKTQFLLFWDKVIGEIAYTLAEYFLLKRGGTKDSSLTSLFTITILFKNHDLQTKIDIHMLISVAKNESGPRSATGDLAIFTGSIFISPEPYVMWLSIYRGYSVCYHVNLDTHHSRVESKL